MDLRVYKFLEDGYILEKKWKSIVGESKML